jgi:nitrogen fixation/metabolism regulation signal transduction histidine kinase
MVVTLNTTKMLNRRLTLLTMILIALFSFAFLVKFNYDYDLLKQVMMFIAVISFLLGLGINFIITKMIDKNKETGNEKKS